MPKGYSEGSSLLEDKVPLKARWKHDESSRNSERLKNAPQGRESSLEKETVKLKKSKSPSARSHSRSSKEETSKSRSKSGGRKGGNKTSNKMMKIQEVSKDKEESKRSSNKLKMNANDARPSNASKASKKQNAAFEDSIPAPHSLTFNKEKTDSEDEKSNKLDELTEKQDLQRKSSKIGNLFKPQNNPAIHQEASPPSNRLKIQTRSQEAQKDFDYNEYRRMNMISEGTSPMNFMSGRPASGTQVGEQSARMLWQTQRSPIQAQAERDPREMKEYQHSLSPSFLPTEKAIPSRHPHLETQNLDSQPLPSTNAKMLLQQTEELSRMETEWKEELAQLAEDYEKKLQAEKKKVEEICTFNEELVKDYEKKEEEFQKREDRMLRCLENLEKEREGLISEIEKIKQELELQKNLNQETSEEMEKLKKIRLEEASKSKVTTGRHQEHASATPGSMEAGRRRDLKTQRSLTGAANRREGDEDHELINFDDGGDYEAKGSNTRRQPIESERHLIDSANFGNCDTLPAPYMRTRYGQSDRSTGRSPPVDEDTNQHVHLTDEELLEKGCMKENLARYANSLYPPFNSNVGDWKESGTLNVTFSQQPVGPEGLLGYVDLQHMPAPSPDMLATITKQAKPSPHKLQAYNEFTVQSKRLLKMFDKIEPLLDTHGQSETRNKLLEERIRAYEITQGYASRSNF